MPFVLWPLLFWSGQSVGGDMNRVLCVVIIVLLVACGALSLGLNHYRDHAIIYKEQRDKKASELELANATMNRPGFPGECFICELRLPDHRFRWKHNKLFLLLPEEYGPAFPAIVDCYTSPPTLVWPVPLLHGFSSSYGVLPPLCKDH